MKLKKRLQRKGGKWYDRATPIKFDARILKIAQSFVYDILLLHKTI